MLNLSEVATLTNQIYYVTQPVTNPYNNKLTNNTVGYPDMSKLRSKEELNRLTVIDKLISFAKTTIKVVFWFIVCWMAVGTIIYIIRK